jgi:hypothetical protein
MFQNILFASHTTCNTILWNFFLLKKISTTNVTLLLKIFAKGIQVPSMIMTPQMLGILVRFSKQVMMFFKC